MESIGDILGKRQDIRENFEKLVAEVLKNADVQAFIAQHQMTSDEIQRSYSKFYEYVREHEKFEKGEKRAADGKSQRRHPCPSFRRTSCAQLSSENERNCDLYQFCCKTSGKKQDQTPRYKKNNTEYAYF